MTISKSVPRKIASKKTISALLSTRDVEDEVVIKEVVTEDDVDIKQAVNLRYENRKWFCDFGAPRKAGSTCGVNVKFEWVRKNFANWFYSDCRSNY